MKKYIIMLFAMISMLVSCVQGNIDINFVDNEKGKYKLTIQVDKSMVIKENVDKEVKKEYELALNKLKSKNVDLKLNDKGEKKSNYVYEFEANFNDFETLNMLFSLSQNYNISELFFSQENIGNKKYIVQNSNNEVELSLGKTNIPVKIKVKEAKILDKKAKGNIIEFEQGEIVSFKYKKYNFKIYYIIMGLIAILIVALLSIFAILKIRKQKNK